MYGAGHGGALVVRELLNDPESVYRMLGFIDDDPHKAGRSIHDCPIYRRAELPELITKYQVTEVLISTPQIPAAAIDEIRQLGIKVSRLQIRLERDPEMVASHV